ncbi:hypothetical protein ACQEVF_11190 [Nonomuraea polychroma]|uniref:hypothetical protein n=1 Tax=Nonomuraea polychroma TaxID=46176 RepID=UPI003D93CFF7
MSTSLGRQACGVEYADDGVPPTPDVNLLVVARSGDAEPFGGDRARAREAEGAGRSFRVALAGTAAQRPAP